MLRIVLPEFAEHFGESLFCDAGCASLPGITCSDNIQFFHECGRRYQCRNALRPAAAVPMIMDAQISTTITMEIVFIFLSFLLNMLLFPFSLSQWKYFKKHRFDPDACYE